MQTVLYRPIISYLSVQHYYIIIILLYFRANVKRSDSLIIMGFSVFFWFLLLQNLNANCPRLIFAILPFFLFVL